MKPIRVMLADDHALLRAGIRALLQADGFEIVGEAGNGHEAIAIAAKSLPDVVLMDVTMPELNGLDAAAAIVAQASSVHVIILSMNSDREYVMQALRAGASGYLLKNASPSELQQAIRSVMRGETYLSSAIAGHVVASVRGDGDKDSKAVELTPRQSQVLQLIAEGFTTKEIARKLHISVNTADTHRTHLMGALGIHDIAGLVRYAIRTGVISPNN